MPLTNTQIAFLKAHAQYIDPVASIGKDGLTPKILKVLTKALEEHELIKVRLPAGNRTEALETADQRAAQHPQQQAAQAGAQGQQAPAPQPQQPPAAPQPGAAQARDQAQAQVRTAQAQARAPGHAMTATPQQGTSVQPPRLPGQSRIRITHLAPQPLTAQARRPQAVAARQAQPQTGAAPAAARTAAPAQAAARPGPVTGTPVAQTPGAPVFGRGVIRATATAPDGSPLPLVSRAVNPRKKQGREIAKKLRAEFVGNHGRTIILFKPRDTGSKFILPK